MKTQTVAVKYVGNGHNVYRPRILEVEAYVFGDLAVHKVYPDNEKFQKESFYKWSISHIPSGLRLFAVCTKQQALDLAKQIAPLGHWQDWQQDKYKMLTLDVMWALYEARKAGYLDAKIDCPDDYTYPAGLAQALGEEYYAKWLNREMELRKRMLGQSEE